MAAWHPSQDELDALARLWAIGQRGSAGGERAIGKLLLGLYNGNRFPFDLTDLRLLDDTNLNDALTVLRMDARPQAEVHVLLGQIFGHPRGNFGREFEARAFDLRLKGRTKKENLAPAADLFWGEQP